MEHWMVSPTLGRGCLSGNHPSGASRARVTEGGNRLLGGPNGGARGTGFPPSGATKPGRTKVPGGGGSALGSGEPSGGPGIPPGGPCKGPTAGPPGSDKSSPVRPGTGGASRETPARWSVSEEMPGIPVEDAGVFGAVSAGAPPVGAPCELPDAIEVSCAEAGVGGAGSCTGEVTAPVSGSEIEEGSPLMRIQCPGVEERSQRARGGGGRRSCSRPVAVSPIRRGAGFLKKKERGSCGWMSTMFGVPSEGRGATGSADEPAFEGVGEPP